MIADADRSDPATVILLMKKPEAEFCGDILAKYRSNLSIRWAWDSDTLERASLDAPRKPGKTRLIGFSTGIIVSETILNRLHGNAYNFHPGPPEFPGNRPSIFAVYRDATDFGVTLHKMTKYVDDGPINDVRRFPCTTFLTGSELAIEAYKRLAQLFIENAERLATVEAPLPVLPREQWGTQKTRYADVDRMRQIPREGISPKELDRRFRAAGWIFTPLP